MKQLPYILLLLILLLFVSSQTAPVPAATQVSAAGHSRADVSFAAAIPPIPPPARLTSEREQLSPVRFTALVTPTIAAPLQPITITLHITDYSGTAELHLYDAEMRPAGRVEVQALHGRAQATIVPRGTPGPQLAVVRINDNVLGIRPNLFTLRALTTMQTGRSDLDFIYPTVRSFLEQNVVSYELDGRMVRGYRSPDNPWIWLRDHVYQGRGFRYFERDMTRLLDAFRRAQQPDGSFPDVLAYPAFGLAAHRLETESDLEYLFVQGVYDAWQATGDDRWLRDNLQAMRGGLAYIMTNPLRWDASRGLVRRPYTIDTWDFAYGPTTIDPTNGKPAPRHWIDDQTIWGIFHGDNTGLAYALRLMTRIERHLGYEKDALRWQSQRRALVERLNAVSWNGTFFTHFVPLTGTLEVPGVDTDAQLSLSNAYALNREVLQLQQAQSIIESYFERRNFERAFAEWYSIDPPFPEGSYGLAGRPGERPGEYVNGGIMPLVGGELARGAFRYGAEDYGFDILRRYAQLLQLTGEAYLWYYPSGQPGISGPDTIPTDGWGSSAMLGALMEGAAGIVDTSSRYTDLELSPRWSAASEITDVRVVARYGASDGYVAYTWQRHESGITLDLTGTWRRAHIRMLLPDEVPEHTVTVQVDGLSRETTIEDVGDSSYALVEAVAGNALVEVTWE